MNGLIFDTTLYRTTWKDDKKRFHSPDENTPAIVYIKNAGRKAGTRVWYKHGKLHRADGPAVENDVYGNIYALEGKTFRTEHDFIAAGGSLGRGKEVNLDL